MKERIEALMAEIAGLTCKTEQEVEEARVRLLGKKGSITALFEEFRTVAPELKREFGQKLNILKNTAAAKIEELKEAVAEAQTGGAPSFDYTMPGDPVALGSRHPVSIAREEIVSIFRKFGYDVAEGPEIEDDWHVFEALNFPPEHPAREMQDTFFISDSDNPVLLRTHTSSVQVRAMEKMPLPIRIVCPGRVFRNEAISARAHCIFHQVEGLYIDENVTFADMKQAILLFAREMFGAQTQIRMRPSYFPFTEPSAEIDVSCNICGGKDVMSARVQAGSRSWAAAWWTLMSLRHQASTARSTAASPSVWAWSVSQCSNGRCATSATTSRTTSASSRSSRHHFKR